MAEKTEDMDLPEGWEVHEEELPEEKKRRDFRVSNNVLWAMFVLIFAAFVALPFLNGSSVELQTVEVNGIPVSAEGDPIGTVRNLVNLHVEGKRLDQSDDSHNALNEILVVMGQSKSRVPGGKYTLLAGLSDKTGITVTGKTVRIEGKSRREFWTAVWTFNSILSDTQIDSTVELYDAQELLKYKQRVYLIQEMEGTCPDYGHVISAEGDIMSSLGYKQSQYGFELAQYQRYEDGCHYFDEEGEHVTGCPAASATDFVITMRKGGSNTITIREDSLDYEFSDCGTVSSISVMIRDLLHPNIISAIAEATVPLEF